MLLRVTFDDGQTRDLALTTSHAIQVADSTGVTDSVAVVGVAALELVLAEPPAAPAVDAPAWDGTVDGAGLPVSENSAAGRATVEVIQAPDGTDVQVSPAAPADPAGAPAEEPVLGHQGAVLGEADPSAPEAAPIVSDTTIG